VLVVAGPGAGKTFCLIERIGHLIGTCGFEAERICAVTFTNKAAEEIAVRLEGTLGEAAEQVTRGTLHALCASLLREHGEILEIDKGFGIADEAYQQILLRRLGAWKKRWGALLVAFGRRRLQGHELTRSDERLFQRYIEHLRRQNMLDFDDLVALTAEMLREHPEVAADIASRWDYVLVDEFQDLNPAQYEILKSLAWGHRNMFGVGDDEQSIFSWTGADPTILKRFATDFGIALPIILDRNRRCSRQIFEVARRLLSVNEPLFAHKEISADRESVHQVAAHGFAEDVAECEWIIADLIEDRETEGREWGNYALLYRTHEVGNALEGRLVRAGVPCRLARGRSLRDDPIIKYVVAAIRLMRQPDDSVLVEGLAQLLLPDGLVDEVRRTVKERELDFLSATQALARARPQPDPDRAKLWRFVYEVQNLTGLRRLHGDLMGIVEELLSKRVGEYRNVLEDHHDELSDPADDANVVDLAAELERSLDGRRKVTVPVADGAGIAVKAMLFGGGVTTVDYDRTRTDDTIPAAPFTLHASGPLHVTADPLTVFKALQLVHARDLGVPASDYVTFDLETTDNEVAACEIVEIGAVRVRRGRPVGEFQALVRPTRAVSARAMAVHGYGEKELRGAPRFEDVWPRFVAFVGNDLLVAHNAFNFDVPVLERISGGLGGFGDLTFFDSYPLARDLLRASHGLGNLAHRFGVATGRAHHALDDARALAGVFAELARLKAVRTRKTTLVNLLDWVGAGLALERQFPETASSNERDLLRRETRIFALGRYSSVLEQYETERALLQDDSLPTVEQLIAKLGGRALMERLRTDRTADQRYPEAVARLRAIVAGSRADTLDETIDRFLERLTLTSSEGVDVDRHRVNLLTLHSTKGLEFPCVYIVGVEDYQIPGYYPTVDNRESEIEEARRLLYVGMTRAEDRLVLTRVNKRRGSDSGGSRFLDEMGLKVTRQG
jgi:superfamily I DNA/RNA helicase